MASSSNRQFKVIFFVPLTILILERVVGTAYYSGYAFLTPTVLEADQVLVGAPLVSGQEAPVLRRDSQRRRMALELLTGGNGTLPTCHAGQVAIRDKSLPYDELFGGNRKIPRIVHQTSRSRCLTTSVSRIIKHWVLGDNWAYYFHSDEAIDRLFAMDWPEFPHISNMVACLNGKGTLKADLWRYLVLWEYGGIYADLDTKPNKFNATSITVDDDGFFIVEQYHLLSQYFMAVSPKHPIMFYTIQDVLRSLLHAQDTGMIKAPQVTGPHALHRGFQTFMLDRGIKVPDAVPGEKPAKAGLWMGTSNRSITVQGRGENENEYVHREYIRRVAKIKEYESMGMKHFTGDVTRTFKSCLQTLWQAQQVDAVLPSQRR